MARRTKDAPAVKSNGRVTPKKTEANTRLTTGRYTAPIPEEVDHSPAYVPVLICVLAAIGFLAIILNYMTLLPGAPTDWYLLVGLGGIVGALVTATQWR